MWIFKINKWMIHQEKLIYTLKITKSIKSKKESFKKILIKNLVI